MSSEYYFRFLRVAANQSAKMLRCNARGTEDYTMVHGERDRDRETYTSICESTRLWNLKQQNTGVKYTK